MQIKTNTDIRFNLITVSHIGYATIPVDVQAKIWCIRTRQNLPVEVIANLVPRVIIEDPKTIVPTDWNDLPYAYIVQMRDDGELHIIKLTNEKRRFITLTFIDDVVYGITTDGDLVTSRQLIEAVVKDNEGLVEFTGIDVLGLPRDARITSLLAIREDNQIRLFIGAITTKTQNWLYYATIGEKETEVHLVPIEAPDVRQVIGFRLIIDDNYFLVGTLYDTIWAVDITDAKYIPRMVYEKSNVPQTAGYNTELTAPAPRASQPGRA